MPFSFNLKSCSNCSRLSDEDGADGADDADTAGDGLLDLLGKSEPKQKISPQTNENHPHTTQSL